MRSRWMLVWICLCLLMIGSPRIASAALSDTEQQIVCSWERGELIRLHILAEDDSPKAQALKLLVRDAVIAVFREKMQGDTAEEVYQELTAQAEDMRMVAETCARANGFNGTVTAEVGLLQLPAKTYGQVTLPAGEYRGLRIKLGAGKGHNWWCILFPSLCLQAVTEEPWQEEQGFKDAKPVSDTVQILRLWPLLLPEQTPSTVPPAEPEEGQG